ncbi:MAG: hypothetical protein IKQ10_11045 [Oscillospiraceae bacterium]|nr:hypothetical protein [Oscillospiraceae bacterium]
MFFKNRNTDSTDDVYWYRPWLGYGEQVLWQGKPERYSLLEKSDWFMIPFSIMWGGFVVFWEVSVILTGAPLLFKLWGIPFVCVGLYITVGRFFRKQYCLRRTVYAVTDRRILRKVGKRVDILEKNALPPMSVEYSKYGTGTIRFGTPQSQFFRRNIFLDSLDNFALVGLSDVQQALEAISAMCRSSD